MVAVHKRLKLFSAVLLAAAIMLALTACTRSSELNTAADSANKQVVLRLEGGDWGFPNPFKHYMRGPGGFKMELLYDSLLEKDENGEIPWLAKEWHVSEDGTVYTFVLQDNVKWHDGEDFSAEDVKFSFDYYKEHSPVWNELIVNDRYIIENVEVIDANKVRIKVNAANATYLSRIGKMRIIPKHIWEDVSDPLKFTGDAAAIGCGPFVFCEYSSELGSYRFKAFDQYWGPKPKVAEIQWVPVSDPVLAFEKGEIDLISAAPDIVSRYQNNAEFKVVSGQPFYGYRLILNMQQRQELQDLNIRKALAYGIDREEMVQKLARGAGIAASAAYLPKGHIWHNDDVVQYSFDADIAKSLLADRQYTFDLLTGNTPPEVKIAELMKISLAEVGIKVNIKSVDTKTRDAAVKKGDFELAVIGHGGWGQDADLLREIYGSSNLAGHGGPASGALPGYYNQKINELCRRQASELDEEKRKQTVFELQRLIAEDVPQVPLFNVIDNFVYRPAKYDGWMLRYDHNRPEHCKLSYLERDQQ